MQAFLPRQLLILLLRPRVSRGANFPSSAFAFAVTALTFPSSAFVFSAAAPAFLLSLLSCVSRCASLSILCVCVFSRDASFPSSSAFTRFCCLQRSSPSSAS
ncbi:unnamed protein product, partial [Citrullus colocynthis]